MKKNKKPVADARLKVKKEILRNLGTADLTAAAGGLGTRPTCGGPCPFSKPDP